jgi:hypothetical protein
MQRDAEGKGFATNFTNYTNDVGMCERDHVECTAVFVPNVPRTLVRIPPIPTPPLTLRQPPPPRTYREQVVAVAGGLHPGRWLVVRRVGAGGGGRWREGLWRCNSPVACV